MYTAYLCASLRVGDKACFKELWMYTAYSCASLRVDKELGDAEQRVH